MPKSGCAGPKVLPDGLKFSNFKFIKNYKGLKATDMLLKQ